MNLRGIFDVAYSDISESSKISIIAKAINKSKLRLSEDFIQESTSHAPLVNFLESLAYSNVSEEVLDETLDLTFSTFMESEIDEVANEFMDTLAKQAIVAVVEEVSPAHRAKREEQRKAAAANVMTKRAQDVLDKNISPKRLVKGSEEYKALGKAKKRFDAAKGIVKPTALDKLKGAVKKVWNAAKSKVKNFFSGHRKNNPPIGLSGIPGYKRKPLSTGKTSQPAQQTQSNQPAPFIDYSIPDEDLKKYEEEEKRKEQERKAKEQAEMKRRADNYISVAKNLAKKKRDAKAEQITEPQNNKSATGGQTTEPTGNKNNKPTGNKNNKPTGSKNNTSATGSKNNKPTGNKNNTSATGGQTTGGKGRSSKSGSSVNMKQGQVPTPEPTSADVSKEINNLIKEYNKEVGKKNPNEETIGGIVNKIRGLDGQNAILRQDEKRVKDIETAKKNNENPPKDKIRGKANKAQTSSATQEVETQGAETQTPKKEKEENKTVSQEVHTEEQPPENKVTKKRISKKKDSQEGPAPAVSQEPPTEEQTQTEENNKSSTGKGTIDLANKIKNNKKRKGRAEGAETQTPEKEKEEGTTSTQGGSVPATSQEVHTEEQPPEDKAAKEEGTTSTQGGSVPATSQETQGTETQHSERESDTEETSGSTEEQPLSDDEKEERIRRRRAIINDTADARHYVDSITSFRKVITELENKSKSGVLSSQDSSRLERTKKDLANNEGALGKLLNRSEMSQEDKDKFRKSSGLNTNSNKDTKTEPSKSKYTDEEREGFKKKIEKHEARIEELSKKHTPQADAQIKILRRYIDAYKNKLNESLVEALDLLEDNLSEESFFEILEMMVAEPKSKADRFKEMMAEKHII